MRDKYLYLVKYFFVLLSDINECRYSRGGCDQLCNNFPGGYNCSCLQGYTLQSDKKSCQGTYTSVEYPALMNTRGGMTNSTPMTMSCAKQFGGSKLMIVLESI